MHARTTAITDDHEDRITILETSAVTPRAKMVATATQAISDSTTTALLFASEDIDDDSGHSTVTNTSRWTSVSAGWYLCSGVVFHGGSTAGTSRTCEIAVNGTTASGGSASSGPRPGGTGSFSQASPTTLVHLNVSDYVELRIFQNSGGSVTTATGSSLTIISAGS